MTSADILLILILAGAFLVGFFWGVLRGLLGLLAWVVVFLLSAHLSDPLGNYLQKQWTNFTPAYVHMLSFLLSFGVLFGLGLFLIQIGTRGSQDLSRYPLVDDILGGLLGISLAVLAIAAVMAILSTFYDPQLEATGAAQWTRELYVALKGSTIGAQIATGLIPIMNGLFDPLLPSALRGQL